MSAGVAAAGSFQLTRRGWVDVPVARSSHTRATRTGGGLAVGAGFLAGAVAALALTRVRPGADAVLAVGLATAMGALGAADDRRPLGPRLKLGVGVAAALALATALPHPRELPLADGWSLVLPEAVSVAGVVLWLVTATNAVNFMDGADGLVPGGLPIAFAALAAVSALGGAPSVSAASLLAAAAYAGFLPFNLRGRLFQGDAGALGFGFLLPALHLAAWGEGAAPLLLGPALLLPWLVDVALTLARRARARRPLMTAHREHLYQRWLQATGRPHRALAARDAGLMLAAAALGGVMRRAPWDWQTPLLAGAAFVLAAGWLLVSRRMDARLAGRT